MDHQSSVNTLNHDGVMIFIINCDDNKLETGTGTASLFLVHGVQEEQFYMLNAFQSESESNLGHF